jgi:hypothetical protein
MQLISDFGNIYEPNNGSDYTKFSYSIGDANFNEYVVYSSFSF